MKLLAATLDGTIIEWTPMTKAIKSTIFAWMWDIGTQSKQRVLDRSIFLISDLEVKDGSKSQKPLLQTKAADY